MFALEIKLGGRICLHAAGGQYPGASRRANSYRCPTGEQPGVAYVLMTRSDVDALDKTGPLTLEMNTVSGGQTTTNAFTGLYFIEATRMRRGAPNDPNAAFLVRLEDKRCLLKWSDTANAQYNVRAWANEGPHLQGTGGFTWSTMVADLWNKMADVLGTFPGLPYAPHGHPENWKFIGKSAWTALHQVLHKLECTTTYDPTTGTFSIVELGAEQTDLANLAGALTFDEETITGNGDRLPGQVRVHFPTWHLAYGQERDTEADNNWSVARSSHAEVIATGSAGSTTSQLWDDLSLVYGENDTPTNLADLTARAQQRVEKFVQRLQSPRFHKVLIGIETSVQPGSQVREITWRHWGETAGGTQTELLGYEPDNRRSARSSRGGAAADQAESLASPDLARRTFPNFPRLVNAVKITGPTEEEEPGDELSPDADNFWHGQVQRYVGGHIATLETCRVVCPEYQPGGAKLRLGQVVLGRLSGTKNNVPVYLAELPRETEPLGVHWGYAEEDITEWTDPASGCTHVTVQVQDDCFGGGEGGSVLVVLPRVQHKLPNVATGDIIAFTRASDIGGQFNQYVCVSDYAASEIEKIGWGVAEEDVTQWDEEGDCTQVNVQIQDNCYGGGEGGTLFVVLPEVTGKRPNIHAGDVLAYCRASDIEGEFNQYVCVSDYTIGENPLVPFILTEDIGNTNPGQASATSKKWDFSTDVETGITVLDNGGIFAGGTSGSKGIATKVDQEYHIVQLACGE